MHMDKSQAETFKIIMGIIIVIELIVLAWTLLSMIGIHF